MKRPHIIFFQTDQHRHDCLGLNNPAIKTPNLDALFAQGVNFRDAVCTVPMCVPSRYSMMTGLYGSQHGVRHNCQMIPNDDLMPVPTIAELFRDNGYQTVGVGKTHWYTGPQTMFDQSQVRQSTRGFDIRYVQYPKGDNLDERGPTVTMEEDAPESMAAWADERTRIADNLDEGIKGYLGGISAMDEKHQRESWLTEKVLRVLEHDLRADTPLFLYFSLDHPHAFFNPPQRFLDQYALDDIPVPPSPPEGLKLVQHFPNIDHTQQWVEKWKTLDTNEKKEVVRKYYALCTFTDYCFGVVIDALKKQGLFDDAFFLFTSDHGDSMGERDRFSKYSLYEGSIRVPLLFAGRGVPQSLCGTTVTKPAELVDILPTLCAVADLPVNPHLPGKNLFGENRAKGSFAELHGHSFDYDRQTIAPIYMWRTGEWKLILALPGCISDYSLMGLAAQGELYNLKEDPLEYTNLYDDEQYLPVRDRLKTELLEHLMMSFARFPWAPSAGLLEKPEEKKGELSPYYRTRSVL